MKRQDYEASYDADGRVRSVRVGVSMMDSGSDAEKNTAESVIAAARAAMAHDAAQEARDAYVRDLTADGSYSPFVAPSPVTTDQDLAAAAAAARTARDAYVAHLSGTAA